MRELRWSVRRLSLIAGLCIIVQALAGWGTPVAVAGDITIDIQVQPTVIALASTGEFLVVHADIAYSAVDAASITLNGLAPCKVKADLNGDLYAKFDLDLVKAIVSPPSATMTLTGVTNDGDTFTGTDTVRVKKN